VRAAEVRALGVDVGVGKGLDVVLLDDRLTPLRVASRVGLERLGSLLDELRPDVVAIDAPPAWAPAGRSRLTERLLAEVNLHAFNTPAADHGRGNTFYTWMETGFEVFKVAAAHGFERYRAGDPRGTAMEVFPHASAAVLAGALPPKGARKKAWRERVLRAHGVVTHELTSADRVDAALCALTGLLALQGKRFAPGDPKEGVIVLPSGTLPARPYRAAPDDAQDETTIPLFRECACDDPACHELTRSEFAPGHDAKRKSRLWVEVRRGEEATEELRRRGWALPPEVR
jgi:predicted nuclease with RNAse H fold